MEKSIIIIGKYRTGKSTLAKALAMSYKENEVFFSSGNIESVWHFARCTRETKLIIIDELRRDTNLELLIPLHESILVNIPCKKSFIINPKIIVVCCDKITFDDLPKGASFLRRFQIIECK